MNYFCSDPHFWHGNIMKYCGRTRFMTENDRDFYQNADKSSDEYRNWRLSSDSIHQMNQGIVSRINARVGRDDHLWCLGDWSMFPKQEKPHIIEDYRRRCREIRDQIHCQNVTLILGNHDRGRDGHYYIADLFSSVHEMLTISIPEFKATLCHYAMLSWNDKGNVSNPHLCLYGHHHNKATCPTYLTNPQIWTALDCGFDSHDFEVWSPSEILSELRPMIESRYTYIRRYRES